MPGREPLSSLVNFPALQSETERVIGLVRSIQEAIDGVGKASSFFKSAKGATEQKAATDGLIESNNQLLQVQKQLQAEQQKSLTLETNLAKQVAIQRELNKEKVTNMRAEAREAAGLNDAYKKLELQYKAAQREAKNLAITPGTPQGAIDAANAKALALSNQLKTVDAAVGQHQRKVGDYVGAVSILERALGEVRERLEQYTQSGNTNAAETQRLRQEQELLTALVNQQAKGFTSVTMELRANERALVSLRAAGMEGTEAFEQLQAAVVKATRQMNEFRKEQKLLESAAPRLAALTTVAKGLGGAYAFAAGSAALFAGNDEKVEKELQKLVAIMTVLQGLNELHELAEKKGAIATLVMAGATRLKNFVMTGSAAGTKAVTAATVENTEAEVVNTEVKEANTAASEANVAGQEEQAVATEATTVATEGASVAMIGLRTALLATGIGALLILLPLVAEAMNKWINGTKEEEERMKKLNEAVKDLNESLVKSNEHLGEILKMQHQQLEDDLKIAEIRARSINDEINLSKRKQEIARTDKQNAEEQLKDLELTRTGVERLDLRYSMLQDKIIALGELQERYAKEGDKKAMEINKRTIDNYQAEIDSFKPKLEQGKKLVEQIDQADQKEQELRAEDEKFAHELYERKIAALTEIDNILRQQQILNTQAFSGSQNVAGSAREQALRQELKLQTEIIESKRDLELRSEKLTNDEREKIRLQAAMDILHIEQDISMKIMLVHAEELQKIRDDEVFTVTQLKEAWDKYLKSLNDNLKKSADLRKLYYEQDKAQRLKILDDDTLAGRMKGIKTGSTKPEEDYQAKRKQIEAEGDINILRLQEDTLNREIAIRRIAHQDVFDLEAQKQTIEVQIEEKTQQLKLDAARRAAAERKKLVNAEKQLAGEVYKTAVAAIEGQFQHELNRIQDRINLNTQLYDKEKTNIANSTLNEQQKAAQMIVLEEQRKVKENQLLQERRNEQLKQAKFEKAKSIFEIGINTAEAIMKAVAASPLTAGMPFTAIVAAIGAAQVAAVLAKPLPHFARGTENAPRGLAIWGEAGQEAKIDRRGNMELSPSRATPTFLQGGERIIPHDKLNEFLYNNMLQATATMLLPTRQDESAKEIRRLQGIIREQGDRADRTARNKSVPRVTIKINPGWDAYIQKSVRE